MWKNRNDQLHAAGNAKGDIAIDEAIKDTFANVEQYAVTSRRFFDRTVESIIQLKSRGKRRWIEMAHNVINCTMERQGKGQQSITTYFQPKARNQEKVSGEQYDQEGAEQVQVPLQTIERTTDDMRKGPLTT